MRRPKVLYIGDCSEHEFAGPLEWLAANAAFSSAPHLSTAECLLASTDDPFDLIVVAIRRPGEHLRTAIESLRAQAPLSAVVGLLGSGCAGPQRSVPDWPAMVRLSAFDFAAQVAVQFERRAQTGAMNWSPPFTATAEDHVLSHPRANNIASFARVLVISQRLESSWALCDALSSLVASVTHIRGADIGDDIADLIIWDCPAGYEASQATFVALAHRSPRTPKIVVLGFPRVDDEARAKRHGATAVVAKPIMLDVLAWQIQRSLASSPVTSR